MSIYGADGGDVGGAGVARGPRTGYDIKAAIDRTIRHFWAASYGQIYPELKRLEAAGWIEGSDGSRGGRARRVYAITAAGRGSCARGSRGRETRIELRDESLLRLFFADTLPRGDALGLLAARREGYARMLAYLRSLDDGTGPGPAVRRPRVPLGARLLRMGDRMVRAAGTPLAPGRLATCRIRPGGSILGRGLPQFAAEAVLPVLVFYGAWSARPGSGRGSPPRRPCRSRSPQSSSAAGAT